MLLILLTALIGTAALVCACTLDKYEHADARSFMAFTAALIIVALLCMIVILGINVIARDADTEAMRERYESLYRQCEYNMYVWDPTKKQLADQVTKWNEEIASYGKFRDSIWVSWFYPIEVEQFNPIPVGMVQRTVG